MGYASDDGPCEAGEPRDRCDEIFDEARELGVLCSSKEIESEAMSEAYEFDCGSNRGRIARFVLFLVEELAKERAR